MNTAPATSPPAPSDGISPPGGWLLALHSSSDRLGVGLVASDTPTAQPLRLEAFDTGRDLANQLFTCLESVLPASSWPQLRRLAVATGPGGFTSTRLTVVLARTLAQQLHLPLDGPSSFLLIARRLCGAGEAPQEPFWLVQELPRRGLVAGRYTADPEAVAGLRELQAPALLAADAPLDGPCLAAVPRLPDDVAELLAISQACERRGQPAPWAPVRPLYPTSPVGQG